MSQRLDELKLTTSSLSVAERAALAQHLLHSLEPAEGGARGEWLKLAGERMADVHAGRVVGISAEEVLNSLPGPPQ